MRTGCSETEPEEGLNGRRLNYPRGKVIGGSSAINAMIYMRGQAADYDHWRQLGLPGWGWDDVLPFFKRHQDHFLGASDAHAVGGEWRIEAPRVRWDILDAFRAAAGEAGIKSIPDFNTGDNEGACVFHVNQKRGRRWSAARGFLKPVLKRPNLRLETHCLVRAVDIENGRAAGVRWRRNGAAQSARCRGEVILAAGSIGSPQILKLSGIGPGAELQELGIAVARELPGVGANLQDHLQLRLIYEITGFKTLNEMYRSPLARVRMGLDYAFLRRGPLTMAPSQLGLFPRVSAPTSSSTCSRSRSTSSAIPCTNFPPSPPACATWRRPAAASCGSARPIPVTSRSSSRTTSPRTRIAASPRTSCVARRIVAQPALASAKPVEYLPGAAVGNDDAALVEAAGDIGTTIFHPVGTAKMGRVTDPFAVVDERLRVIGVERLRVVDASVMPTITSGNTNAPTMMIAEKGAEMIREDRLRA